MALCPYIGVAEAQRAFEEHLEKKRKGVLAPPSSRQHIFFIDDVTMDQGAAGAASGQRDGGAINPTVLELMRQYQDHQQWYDLTTRERRTVEAVNFATCFTFSRGHQATSKYRLSSRQLAHHLLVGLNSDEAHLRQIFSSIIVRSLEEWPDDLVNAYKGRIVECTLKIRTIYCGFIKNMKASAFGFLQVFHVAALYRILHAVACFDHYGTSLSEFEIAKLLSAEAYRSLLDKFKDKADRKLINAAIQSACREEFSLSPKDEQFPSKLGKPLYSHLCGPELNELSYREVEKTRQVRNTIEQFMKQYEKAQPKLDIPMFDFMAEQIIKINRAIQQPFGNVLLVGPPGLGKVALSRLAIFTCQYRRHEMPATDAFSRSTWRGLLKEMAATAVAQRKAQVLNLGDGQVANEEMLADLTCLLKHGQIPGLFNRSEWQNLYNPALDAQSAAPAFEGDPGPKRRKRDARPSGDVVYVVEVMNRSRRHFKFIINASPDGPLLNDYLRRYAVVLNTSTVIWMEDWPEEGFRDVAKLHLKGLDEHHAGPEPSGQETPLHARHASPKANGLRGGLIEHMLRMHKEMQGAVQSYARATGHSVSVTPRAFINLVDTVVHLHKLRTDYYEKLRTKYKVGLDQIRRTEEHVCAVQRKLSEIAPVLVEKQAQIEDLLKELDLTTGQMKERVKFVEEEEAALEAEKSNATTIKDECQRQFDEAIPLLKKAIHGLKKL